MQLNIAGIVRGSPQAVAREFRQSLKGTLVEVGRGWHSDILPDHFRATAVARYGYTKRGRGYQIRKARQKGHQKPLVWSGRTERDATRIAEITSTSKRVTVRLRVPPYIYKLSRGRQNPIDAERELSATTADEETRLSECLAAAMEPQLEKVRLRERVAWSSLSPGGGGG